MTQLSGPPASSPADVARLGDIPSIDPMPPLMRAYLSQAKYMPVGIGFFGGSTFQDYNATSIVTGCSSLLTSMIQRAYPNGLAADESSTQVFGSATAQTVNGVHGYRAGIAGAGTANYLTDDMVTRATSTLAIKVRFHLPFQNDRRNNVAPATSVANVRSWITKLRAAQTAPAVDIILGSYSAYDSTSIASPYTNQQYMAAAKALEQEFPGAVYVIDLSPYWVPLGVPAANGIDDVMNFIDTDNLHMLDAGHRFWAELVRNLLGIPVENTPVALLPAGGAPRAEQPSESLVLVAKA